MYTNSKKVIESYASTVEPEKVSKKLPDFVKFDYDDERFKQSISVNPFSYKWQPAMLKVAFNVLDDIFYAALQSVDFLKQVYNTYDDSTEQFAKEILADFQENEAGIKKYIQHYIVTKHEHTRSILTECLNETIALWGLVRQEDECEPQHLAVYTTFLLFFKLSHDDVKMNWRETVNEREENGEKEEDDKFIVPEAYNAARDFAESFGEEVSTITDLLKIANNSPIKAEFNKFFVTNMEPRAREYAEGANAEDGTGEGPVEAGSGSVDGPAKSKSTGGARRTRRKRTTTRRAAKRKTRGSR
jgi:hypothetical protein